MRANSNIDSATNEFKGALENIQGRGQDRETDQCWHALTWKHTVIDLQHEKGAREHQYVNDATEYTYTHECAAA